MIPNHLGIIPDGNRRYAKKMNIPVKRAYEAGVQKLVDVLEWSKASGIRTVTSWGFSTENFSRSSIEKKFLFRMFEHKIKEMLNEGRFDKERLKVSVIGHKESFPKGLVSVINEMEESTRNYDGVQLNLALGYGGQQEILDACNAAISSGAKRIDAAQFESFLYFPGNVDMILRTSGENRTSGFLPWQASYAELVSISPLWPEMTERDFSSALQEFESRQRRFGR